MGFPVAQDAAIFYVMLKADANRKKMYSNRSPMQCKHGRGKKTNIKRSFDTGIIFNLSLRQICSEPFDWRVKAKVYIVVPEANK